MGDDSKEQLDSAPERISDALEKWLDGKPESAVATAIVVVTAVVTGSPWALAAQGPLRRLFERLNNGKGKAAVQALEKQLSEAQQTANVVQGVRGVVDELLTLLLCDLRGRDAALVDEHRAAVATESDSLLQKLALLLHRTEERLLQELSPNVRLWRALSPGTRATDEWMPPSALLVAAHRAVPFVGHDRLLAQLISWATSEAPTGLALVTGRGGAGKTRLAIELAVAVRASGIPAGFATTGDVDGVLCGSPPRLIVIDYAEGKIPLLRGLLQRLSAGQSPKTRLVLLARDRGEWWQALRRVPETDPLLLQRAKTVSLDYDDIAALTFSERKEIWQKGIQVFGNTANQAVPPDFAHETFQRPLPLLMHALIQPNQNFRATEPDLLAKSLDHEWRHIEHSLELMGLATWQLDGLCQVVRFLLALTTMVGATTKEALTSIVTDHLHTELGDAPNALVSAVLEKLRALYPGPGDTIGPLEPDILGEELVARMAEQAEHLLDVGAVLSRRVGGERRLVAVLAGDARRNRDTARIDRLLARHLEQFALAAVDVCLDGRLIEDPVATALSAELRRRGGAAAAIASNIEEACPRQTVALADVAATAATIAYEDALRSNSDDDDDAELELLAKRELVLARRLSAVGRDIEGLSASRSAVTRFEVLRRRAPSRPRPDEAEALVSLGANLSRRGEHQEAIPLLGGMISLLQEQNLRNNEDVQILLATAHDALAHSLLRTRSSGCLRHAQIALELRLELARKNPDVFLPMLARSLDNTSTALAETGNTKDALFKKREAVRIYRRLAREDPDAYLMELQRALMNFAEVLRNIGKPRGAMAANCKAISVLVELPRRSSARFRPALALALSKLSSIHAEAGAYAEATPSGEEAVRLLRQCVEADAVHERELAETLRGLGRCYLGESDPTRAVRAFIEAIGVALRANPVGPSVLRFLADAFADYRRACKAGGIPVDPALAARVAGAGR